jgi:type IV pilus assembly protein PilM
LTSLTTTGGVANQFYRVGLVGRIDRWLHAMPHPSLVVEIAGGHVAAARWGKRRGHLEGVAVESLPLGAVMPSTVETNITQPDAVRSALRRVFTRIPDRGAPIALLVPDLAVRVFILPFDNLPRRAEDALPLLRWRLKKSVPFDVDETVVSWNRQDGREGNLEVVIAVARQQIVREYEQIVEALGAHAGVVLGSTLATLPLLEERGSTLLVRLCGKMLTTVITHGSNLCVYRSSEMAAEAKLLEPQAMLDEVFPAVAYYQDTWGSTIDRARLTGFGDRESIFGGAVAEELKVSAGPLAEAEGVQGLDASAKDLVNHGLDALAGWMMNGRA